MNVYDFDKTIYSSDCTADFYFYCIKKYPSVLLKLPYQGISFMRFLFGNLSKTEFKQKFYTFLKSIKNHETLVNDFWDKHIHKIKKWYIDQQKDDDVVISASPEFLIKPICLRLGIKYAYASKVNIYTGEYDGINCHGEEKVRRFYEVFPEGKIDEFYSDSFSDTPLAELAERSYIVKGDRRIRWEEAK